MPVPTFDKMLRPILEAAASREITRRFATDLMIDHFKLTPEEQAARIPSGAATFVNNRAGWAMTFLTKARLISKIAPKTYRATESGRSFLAKHPIITVRDLKKIDGWEESWRVPERSRAEESEHDSDPLSTTPAEAIDEAIGAMRAELRIRLIEAILRQSPSFFEELVLDVLLAMGYGGSREDAAHHLGRSGDEGIDGRINQDALGLDQIMVQAKRYALDRSIDRKTIQAFVGSLAGHGVTKGVFITTSSFAATAEEFVSRGSNTKIILIDGNALIDLMIRYKIGVRAERKVELLEIDQNYFEDDTE